MPIIAKVVDFDVHSPIFLKRFHKKYIMPHGIFGCWIWIAHKNKDGYGKIKSGRYKCHDCFTASRISHEIYKGVVLPELQIDHLCREKSCVNPFCLEVVTPKVNCERKPNPWAHVTHCPQGHEYTDENMSHRKNGRSYRVCKICHDVRQVKRRENDARVGRGSWQKIKTSSTSDLTAAESTSSAEYRSLSLA